MKIDSCEIGMKGSSEQEVRTEKKESLVYWQGGQPARERAYLNPVTTSSGAATLQDKARSLLNTSGNSVSLNFSHEALSKMMARTMMESEASSKTVLASSLKTTPSGGSAGLTSVGGKAATSASELQIRMIEELFFRITGKRMRIKLLNSEELLAPKDCSFSSGQSSPMRSVAPADGQAREAQGWGLDYNYSETRYESEKMSFSAKGVVRTADGTEISLDVSLSMSREFFEEKSLTVKAGDALVDPLVINYAGGAVELSDMKFDFDLDMDGKMDQISALEQGSGFLALDKNGDGKINDGGELFGPSTGGGFKELASYDEDKNGWIDENDSVYKNLRIWEKAPDGTDRLLGLAEASVGAVCLDKAKTGFSLTGDNNELNGKIRETGIYLSDTGRAGVVHELDLVV